MLTFTVNEQQADQILNALGQRPYVESAGLIGLLLQQAQGQQPQTAQAQQQQPQTQVYDRPFEPAADANQAALANGHDRV